MKKVVVHFGLAKTGSTSFQRYMHDNKLQYIEHGILYPGNYQDHWAIAAFFDDYPLDHYHVQNILLEDEKKLEHLKNEIDYISSQFELENYKIAVISTENLSAVSEIGLKRLAEYLGKYFSDIELVGYVRDPISYCVSMIQEDVKNGFLSGDIDFGYLRGNVEILDKLVKNISPNLKALKFEPSTNKIDTVSALLDLIGIKKFDYKVKENLNKSLNYPAAAILSHYNKIFPPFVDGKFIKDGIRDWVKEEIIESSVGGQEIILSKDSILKIISLFKPDAQRLKDDYGIHFESCDINKNYSLPASIYGKDKISINLINTDDIIAIALNALDNLSKKAWFYNKERLFWAKKFFEISSNDENFKKVSEQLEKLIQLDRCREE